MENNRMLLTCILLLTSESKEGRELAIFPAFSIFFGRKVNNYVDKEWKRCPNMQRWIFFPEDFTRVLSQSLCNTYVWTTVSLNRVTYRKDVKYMEIATHLTRECSIMRYFENKFYDPWFHKLLKEENALRSTWLFKNHKHNQEKCWGSLKS